MGFLKWLVKTSLKTMDFFLYFLIFAGIINILTTPKDFFSWGMTIFCIGFILLNRFLIRQIDRRKITNAEAKRFAAEMADNMVDSMKTVVSYSGKHEVKKNIKIDFDDINKKKKQYFLRDLNNFKKAGIKKVELLCIDDCECCMHLKNREIPIKEIEELPNKNCPLELCRGRYVAVVEFG